MEIQPLASTAEKVEETPSERRLSANLDKLQSQRVGQDKGVLLREKLRHQFKIIDYGLANFDETFAAGPDVVVDVRFLSFHQPTSPGTPSRFLATFKRASLSPAAFSTSSSRRARY